MDYLENLLAARSAFSFDEQIRYLGWALLLLWMFSITYMTREFWFPAAFGKRAEERRQSLVKRKPSKSDRYLNELNRDLRLLADECRRKCQLYLMKKRKYSTID